MSAWVVSKDHIDVLVNAAAEYGVLGEADPHRLGHELWRENVRSVNYRYGERARTPGYRLVTTEAPLHPLAVLKAVGCYRYQTCERQDWRKSRAFKITERLHAAVLARHPELAEQVPSKWFPDQTTDAYSVDPLYDALPWGFESLADAEAHRYART